MGLGLESKIAQMDPKLKRLFGNIISILFIVTVLYGVLSLIINYSFNVMSFMQSPDLVTVILMGFFLYLAWALLSGKSIKVPEQKKDKKTQFNIPNLYATKKPTRQRPQRKPKLKNNPVIRGSWKCPKCEFLVVATSRCPVCGFQRRR